MSDITELENAVTEAREAMLEALRPYYDVVERIAAERLATYGIAVARLTRARVDLEHWTLAQVADVAPSPLSSAEIIMRRMFGGGPM